MASDLQTPTPDDGDPPRGRAARLLRLPLALAGKLGPIFGSVLAPLRRFRRVMILSACGLFALISAVAVYHYVQGVRESTLAAGLTIEAALEQLDAGENSEARQMAKLLPRAKKMDYQQLGEVHFVIGAALAHETDDAWDEPNRTKFYALAARHLQQSRDRRFPIGREAEGRLLLGHCLIEAGDYEQALAPLLEIDDSSPTLKTAAQRLLAIAYLKSSPADLAKATRHAKAYSGQAQTTPTMREQAALLQGKIALANGNLDVADALIQQIPDNSQLKADRQMLHGRLLMARAAAMRVTTPPGDTSSLTQQAIAMFRETLSHHIAGEGDASQASYLIGVALREQGQAEAAAKQFFRTRKRFYNTPEAIMASLEEAEVLLELGKLDEGRAALEETAALISAPGATSGRLDNPYITQKQLGERIEKSFEILYGADRFDLAVALAKTLTPLVGKTEAAALQADSLHRWGQHLAARATTTSTEDAEELLRGSRKKYRHAGDAYALLAQQQYVNKEYPTELWRSGQNFNLGRDYRSAITMFNAYLKTEAQTERPLVLIELAKAQRALNQNDDAIATIEMCLRDFARDPAVYESRLLASSIYVENGNRERAKQLLRENLHHESLTPLSDAWRDSLFALGMVLHDEGTMVMLRPTVEDSAASAGGSNFQTLERGHTLLQEAIRHLTEAVARYPQAEQALEARYAIAQSYRDGARLPLVKLKHEAIEGRRAALNRQAEEELTAALEQYDELIELMNTKSHVRGKLAAHEEKVLRNAYFARGTALYDLGSYEAAIKAYSTATSRYQHEPAAIEAYVQIAACYRRLNKPTEARGTLERAKLVIERIHPDVDFASTTRYGRDEWNTLLQWMSAL